MSLFVVIYYIVSVSFDVEYDVVDADSFILAEINNSPFIFIMSLVCPFLMPDLILLPIRVLKFSMSTRYCFLGYPQVSEKLPLFVLLVRSSATYVQLFLINNK